eukprot:TRINITY_DN54578_c0_g1_i1.p1 TRINITY_DN54578_c0_g1~~TRINITY_DN54578_c0_g1_i1.p1  ORF type:complete len:398 (+),score=77.36 TRINITY_DN54578_c0_g1_i1:57-1250(+)
MGNALGDRVDGLLKGVLEHGSSNVQVGLGNANYTTKQRKLRPIRLAEGLYLKGEFKKLLVSTKTSAALSGAVGAMLGASATSPPLNVEAEGICLLFHTDDSSSSGTQDRTPQGNDAHKNSPAAPPDAMQHLKQLTVNVQDIAVELKLDGHSLRVSLQSLQAKPAPKSQRSSANWQVEHKGLKLELDGSAIARASDASAHLNLAPSLRRVDGSLQTEVRAHLDVEQLSALLDVAATIVAVAAAESMSISGEHKIPWSLKFRHTRVELSQFGDRLLELGVKEGSVSCLPTSVEVQVEPVEVKRSGTPEVVSSKFSVRVDSERSEQQPSISVQHSFPESFEGPGALPWAGTIDLLLDDPRFSQHKVWLQYARDIKAANSRKRALDDMGDSGDIETKRSKL